MLPQLWARNTWDWRPGIPEPKLSLSDGGVAAWHNRMPERRLDIDSSANWLFCRNETNTNYLYGDDAAGPFKDGINDYLVNGQTNAIGHQQGTKCAAHVGAEAGGGRTACDPAALASSGCERKIRLPIMMSCLRLVWPRPTPSTRRCSGT